MNNRSYCGASFGHKSLKESKAIAYGIV